jgi:hypothetical protein
MKLGDDAFWHIPVIVGRVVGWANSCSAPGDHARSNSPPGTTSITRNEGARAS